MYAARSANNVLLQYKDSWPAESSEGATEKSSRGTCHDDSTIEVSGEKKIDRPLFFKYKKFDMSRGANKGQRLAQRSVEHEEPLNEER